MAQPTSGSIKAIYNDQKDSPLCKNPVVQVINIKKVPTSNNVNRYRVIISDGTYFMQAMLASQHTQLVENETLQKHSLIVLKDYVCNSLQNRKIIIALNIEVLPNSADMQKFGNPVNLEAKMMEENGKPESDQQTGQQQLFVQGQQSGATANTMNNTANAASINNTSARSNNVYAEANLFPIKSLNPYQNRWFIKARVSQKSDIKFWHKNNSEGKLFSVNLLDKSGEIKATAFNAEVDRLHPLLQENKTYYISKARVSMAKKQFSNLNNDYELVFESGTEIEECHDESLPTMSFNFVPIAKLDDGIDKGDTVDVIGLVKEDEGVQEIVSKASGKPVKKRQLTIVDKSQKQIKLTLWDRQAESFDSSNSPIIACKGCRVGDFGGRSLSLLSSGTLKVNPNIPEANELRQWYNNVGHTAQVDSFSGPSLGNASGTGSSTSTKKSLAEVKGETLGVGEKADFFNVRARVVYMKSDNCSYPACPECKKKLVEEGSGSWRCEKDQKSFPEPDYRYILSISLADATTQMFMSAFDEVGVKLLGKTATEMVHLRETDNTAYQNVFRESYFQPYNFKCKAKMESYNETARTKYTIMEATPVDYATDGHQLVNEIDTYISAILWLCFTPLLKAAPLLPTSLMPLFHRNVSEPILPGTMATSAPPMETSFSYSHHMSPSSASDSGSAAESPSVSALNPAERLTQLELENTIRTHQSLINAASLYREQAEKLAEAAAELGSALELVAKEKAATDSGTGLQAAAGLQFLISNHHLLLASTISTAFEEPLIDNLERHKDSIHQSQQNFENVVRTMNQKISETELRSLQNSKKKKRDLRQFRRVLQDLTHQIDELETVKVDYSRYVFETERRNHQFILSKVSGLVRAQVDIFERISSKGLGEPTLENMFLSNPDPFCAYPTSDESKAIFSVLPPMSLIDAAISSGQDSLLVYGCDTYDNQVPPPTPPPKSEVNEVLAKDKTEPSPSTESLYSQQLDTQEHYERISETEGLHNGQQEETVVMGVRTDYSDDALWEIAREQFEQSIHGQSQQLKIQSDLALKDKTIEHICQSCPAKYIVIADSETMKDCTFKLVKCLDQQSVRFRAKDFGIIMDQLPLNDKIVESLQTQLS